MFGTNTDSDRFSQVASDLAEFQKNPSSSRLAMNSATSAYHFHEWIWAQWLKRDEAVKTKLAVEDKHDFLKWLDDNEPWFKLIQDIVNGIKHLKLNNKTRPAGAFQANAFQPNAFDSARLEINVGTDAEPRWILAGIVLEKHVKFWRDFFREYADFDPPLGGAIITEFK